MKKFFGIMLTVIFSLAVTMPVSAANKTTQQIYSGALDALIKAKTAEIKGNITVSAKANKNTKKTASDDLSVSSLYNSGSVGIDFEIRADKSNPEEQRSFFNFAFRPSKEIKENFPLDNLKVVSLSNVSYFFIEAANLNLGFLDLSAFANQWIKLDGVGILQKIMGEKYDSYKEQVATQNKNNEITPKQIEDVIKLFKKDNVFTVYRLADKKIGDQSFYRLRLSFNRAGFRKFMLDVSKQVDGKAMTAAEIKDLDKTIKTWQVPDSFLLVNKISGNPVQLDLVVNDNNTARKMTTKVLLKFISFNDSVDITAPAESRNFEDILQELMKNLQASLNNTSSTSGLVGATSTLVQ